MAARGGERNDTMMDLRFRPARVGEDCELVHRLIVSEAARGIFDPGLLNAGSAAVLRYNLDKMAIEREAVVDASGKTEPAEITMVDLDGVRAGFGVTKVIEGRAMELWLAGVVPEYRRRGLMSELLQYYCASIDQWGMPLMARLLPGSDAMRSILLRQGFHVSDARHTGQVLIRAPSELNQ
jgi:ribosomal protein S18 acetylase RimI-like enzyme